MGGGGGSSPPSPIGGISGQGGGRILPGAAGGVGELIMALPRSLPNETVSPAYPDLRPNSPFGWFLDTAFCQPGGGPGEPGKGSEFVVYAQIGTDANGAPVTNLYGGMGGGGGGWGAMGGTADAFVPGPDGLSQNTPGANPGGAGGKAINTNNHAVTWLGGANRTYGAVG